MPKDPKTRQRRNRDTTAASLIDTSPIADGEIPPMPDIEDTWHPRAVSVWGDIWRSPMATEYTQADVHRVELYVQLLDAWYKNPTIAGAGEIRLQGVCLGVTPIDRRRLQWEIKRVEPEKKPTPKRSESKGDPRASLRAV